jgi:hypothetical protein
LRIWPRISVQRSPRSRVSIKRNSRVTSQAMQNMPKCGPPNGSPPIGTDIAS